MINAREAMRLTDEGLVRKEEERQAAERKAAIEAQARIARESALLPLILMEIDERVQLITSRGERAAVYNTRRQLHPTTVAIITRNLRDLGYLVTIEYYGGSSPYTLYKLCW